MARTDEEYDWLEDAFDDKKSAEAPRGMPKSSKRALGIALVAVIVVVVALVIVGLSGAATLFSF